MPLYRRNNRTLIRLSRVGGTEGRDGRLIELVRHSSVPEGARIETRPEHGWCFDLFCLRVRAPDPPYVPVGNQSCLPFDFDLVPRLHLPLSLSLPPSFAGHYFFNRPSSSNASPGHNRDNFHGKTEKSWPTNRTTEHLSRSRKRFRDG